MAGSTSSLLEAIGMGPEQAATFEQMLADVGFAGADAAWQLGQIQRRADLGRSQIGLAGEEARESIKASAEGRGVLRSGETGKKLSRQRAKEGTRLSELELAAADDVAGIQRDLYRMLAESRTQDFLQDEQRRRRREDEQYALGLMRQDYQDELSSFGGGYSGADPYGSEPSGYAPESYPPKRVPDVKHAGSGFKGSAL